MKAKKNLISLVRVLVKPEYQNKVIDIIVNSKKYLINTTYPIPSDLTIHGIQIDIWVTDDLFESYDPRDWNEYPKFSPEENGFYYVKFANESVYIRRWIDGSWWDITGKNKSKSCSDITEFKFYKKEL